MARLQRGRRRVQEREAEPAERIGASKESDHAARNDRTRPHGRQHGPSPARRRPQCVVFDRSAKAIEDLTQDKAIGAAVARGLREEARGAARGLADGPGGGRGRARSPSSCLHLTPGDILIDGGNSYYVDDIRRAKELAEKGIHYVDVGTSGGVWGRERGYCLMIGGEAEVVQHLDPIFARLAPGAGDIPRTPGRERVDGTAEQGYLHCGPNGAGHFVKMVHNGIEYGLMAAYAEGLGILRSANVGQARPARVDAETTPLRDPRALPVRLRPSRGRRGVAARQRRRLLAARPDGLRARARIPRSSEFAGRVSDSGEGRWTINGRDRRGGAGPRAHLRALRALQLARRGGLRGQAALGHALRVRRAPSRRRRAGREAADETSDTAPTRSCSSARRAISPTRRSSRRCRRWRSAAISTCRSSAWPRRAGTSSSSGPGPGTASRSTAASIRERSRTLASGCATSTATTRRRRRSRPSVGSSGPPGARRTTWPSRPRLFELVVEQLAPSRAARTARASSSRSRSAATPLPRGSSTRSCSAPSTSRRSSASTTTSGSGRCTTCCSSASPTPSWSPSGTGTHVESVQITMAEDFGVQGRGGFYDETGADPRRGPEPSLPGPVQPRHGAAGADRQRVDPGREGQGPESDPVAGRGRHRARAVPRVPVGAGRGARTREVETFVAVAPPDRFLALARRALLHPRRQVPAR